MQTKQKTRKKIPAKRSKKILLGAKTQMAMPVEIDVSIHESEGVKDGK